MAAIIRELLLFCDQSDVVTCGDRWWFLLAVIAVGGSVLVGQNDSPLFDGAFAECNEDLENIVFDY